MKSIIIDAFLIISIIAIMVTAVMLYDWTGLRIGGFLVIPATILLVRLLERHDNLPHWFHEDQD